MVVAKSIGYNKKVLNLYRLNVKEKLKAKNGVLPNFIIKSEGRKGYSVPRLRGQNYRSQEAMKFNISGSSSSSSRRQSSSARNMVQVSCRRERRVSVSKDDFDGVGLELDVNSLKISEINTVQSLNSSLGAGDQIMLSSPKITPATSRINSVSNALTPNSSCDNLSSIQVAAATSSIRKQSSEQTTKSSIVDDAYSSGSESDSDSEDTSYYVGLELINRFDPKVLVEPETNSPLTTRRRSTNTRNDRRSRNTRSPRRRSASATRNRNVSDIKDSLKINLNDTI